VDLGTQFIAVTSWPGSTRSISSCASIRAEAALHQARVRLGLMPDGTDDRVDVGKTSVVRQAKAQLDDAALTRERTERLWHQELVARAQLDTVVSGEQVAEARYHDAIEEARNRQAILAQRRSELEMARQALTDSVLTAPAEGIIRERRAAVGEYLAAGRRSPRWCASTPSARRWRFRSAPPPACAWARRSG